MTPMLVCFLALLLLAAAYLVIFYGGRSAEDVLFDLADDFSPENSNQSGAPDSRPIGRSVRYDAQERGAVEKELRLYRFTLIAVPLLLVCVRASIGALSISGLLLTLFLGAAIGYLVAEARKRKASALRVRRIEFFLPIVMERLVMAVQAGHDILAALKALIDLEASPVSKSSSHFEVQEDPVMGLLRRVYRLAESGVGVERSLHDVAASVNCPALRHAFIHLAQAHKEGGELVSPLRELSDSTQLYYQESVEEEIAKLPVKATLPLLCTFAGLIIFFLTAPLIQVLDITTKAMPK